MISRRDNLLTRPWQDRKYENHRRKVKSALPAIDNRSPPKRNHVILKIKKCQKETERCEQITKENLILLKKLSNTMRTSHVDNYWTTPQPNFLNRVTLYNNIVPRFEDMFIDFDRDDSINDTSDDSTTIKDRKSKCYACTPQKLEEVKIPEERVPWEPEKLPVSNRKRSKSVPVHKHTENLPIITKKSFSASTASSSQRAKSSEPLKYNKNKLIRDLDAKSSQSIILSRGCLKLSVNFPSDTLIKLQEGSAEKVIMQGLCHCNKSYKTVL